MRCYQLIYYVPESHLQVTKQALFAAGAGRLGNYDQCCWQTPGQGQFRPLAGSQPYAGSQGEVETLLEYRVEMVVLGDCLESAVGALLGTHPYEEPAYSVWPLERPGQPD